jgi:hypothetical protein
MMNQVKYLAWLVVIRNMVTANEVLLQADAAMEKVEATL